MNFYDVINKRRTIREFTNQDVPLEVLERILDAGLKAPYSMLAEASCLVLPYFKQSTNMYNPKDAFALINYGATWALIENMLLAATAEGLACALYLLLAAKALISKPRPGLVKLAMAKPMRTEIADVSA